MKLPACRGFNLLPDTLGRQLPMLDFSGVEESRLLQLYIRLRERIWVKHTSMHINLSVWE